MDGKVITKSPELDSPKSSGEASSFTARKLTADQCRDFHQQFELLADEERARVEDGAGNRKKYYESPEDRFIRVLYDCHADRDKIWPKGKPAPRFWFWHISAGPTEDIQARLMGIAAQLGKALDFS